MNATFRLATREEISAAISCIGVCIFLAFSWVAWQLNLPLLLLSSCAITSIIIAPTNFPRRTSPAAFLLVALFIASYMVSALASQRWPQNLAGSERLLPALLVYFVVVIQLDRVGHYRAISRVLCTLSVAVSTSVIAALWSGTEGNSRQLAQAAQNSLLLVPNDIALVAVIAPFCLAEVTLKSAFIWRCVGLLGLFGGIVASVVLSSRTAFIAQIVAIACMTGRSVGWRSKGFWCGLIGTLVVAIAIDSIRGFALFDKFIGSTGTRGSLWVAAIEMFIDAPLFGHGPHSFGELWREYLARARFPLIFPVDREAMYWPHNLFLELLSEFGIFGLTVFMLLTGRAIAASWSLSNVSQLEIAKLARPLFVALVSFLVAASLELTLQRVWVVNFWFALLALVEGLRLTASVATRSREV